MTITATYQGRNATATVRVPIDDGRERAKLVISFRPDPVPASLTPCTGPFKTTPSWSSDEIITEMQGVGFTVTVETLNLYNENGLYQTWRFPEDYYFSPNSQFVEDGCTTPGGAPSGFAEEILEGIDDLGHRLTFSSRVRLLPVSRASSTPLSMLIVPSALGGVSEFRHAEARWEYIASEGGTV